MGKFDRFHWPFGRMHLNLEKSRICIVETKSMIHSEILKLCMFDEAPLALHNRPESHTRQGGNAYFLRFSFLSFWLICMYF